MDAEAQIRPLFDRMAVDFAQMVKRTDVDYYLKSASNAQSGNDQMAFYSTVPGYYPSSGSQSPVSLVAYRINAQNKLERMAKGLVWNGVSTTDTPIVFLPLTITGTWPAATNDSSDSDYELIGPYVFRFEYYYFLKDGALSEAPGGNGMQDVAAICVSIGTIDPTSRVLVSDSQLTALAGRMNDFTASMKPGDLLAQWQSALDSTTDIARPTVSAIRIYQRYFHLMPKS